MEEKTNKIKTLMLGLYYPAVLGTALVVFILRIMMHPDIVPLVSDLALYYGFLLIVFFSACFLATHDCPPKKYGKVAFVLDLIEVLAIFLVYYFLQLFETTKIVTPNFRMVYGVLAVTVVLQQLWTFTTEGKTTKLLGLRIIAFALFTVGAFWAHKYDCGNIVVLVCSGILVWWYLYRSLGR